MRDCVQGRCPPCQPLRRSLWTTGYLNLVPIRQADVRNFMLCQLALSGTSDISIERHR